MKMYKEMLRKLMPIGLPLALITLIYTVITSGQNYFGLYTQKMSQAAVSLAPVLVYYTFTAILFALYGFSYLFRRAASDLYHGLPVSRTELYLSTTLATATWMGGTILINLLLVLLMLLISGCPFVPVYIPLAALHFFVASMLVFGATAIGCALSGTMLTALASTGIVLFLPRFLQFVMARGVVDKVPIVGWLDLPVLLNPITNVATGMVVMQTRQVFMARLIQLPYVLYSLLPMALYLVLGGFLFRHRPSEVAERGAGRKLWAVATAALLATTVLVLITVGRERLLSAYNAALIVVAFLVFVVYQVIASRRWKQILVATPIFLASCVLALGVGLGISALNNAMLSRTPTPAEIASIQFRGHDEKQDRQEYTTLLLENIRYTSDSMKKYVSENLADAVDRIKDPNFGAFDVYGQYQVIEPLEITLTDGTTFKRTIEFKNVMTLNQLREEDSFFQAAIRAFPAMENIQRISGETGLKAEENQALLTSFINESQRLGLVPNDYYRSRIRNLDDQGFSVDMGGEQSLGRIDIAGVVTARRIYEYYNLRMETPETAALLLRTYNAHMKDDVLVRLGEAVKHMTSPLVMENESLSMDLSFYNMPNSNGDLLSKYVNIYISGYSKQQSTYADLSLQYAQQFADILRRGTPADQVEGMFVKLNWYEYDGITSNTEQDMACYLKFSPEDEAALKQLVADWQTATTYR